MKRSAFMLPVIAVAIISLVSCGKEQPPVIEKAYTIELDENQEYTFTLPQNIRKDAYVFTSQAQHYQLSQVMINNSGEQIYQYIPSQGYYGTDQVIVSNEVEKPAGKPSCNGNGGSLFGNCCMNNQNDDHYKITFNFVVRGASVSNVK